MIRIKDIHHVVYRHPDLDAAEAFFCDFGMSVQCRDNSHVYFRGAGQNYYIYIAEKSDRSEFVSMAFEVEDRQDLERASRLDGASSIQRLERPGGGERVTLQDPSGRQIDLVHGIASTDKRPMRAALVHNTADAKQRLGELQRPGKGPAEILRLGHIALGVKDLKANLDWYKETLGLLPSDMVVEGSKDNAHAVFLRLNRGQSWTDHHTVALFTAPEDHVHHASFEVQDVDAQILGNTWMKERGWSPFWGVGRHLLGSQIFDYWYDPSGNIVEHFTDGDLYNSESSTGFVEGGDDSLYQWGPEMSIEKFLGLSGQ
ncbi:bleomycin resistance protein [Halomonas campisalis]|uniref:Bleomycin resistance protein n=1 Tax=Billgrantia campisalis TaxID=74661 RepID=A0ABS9PCW2_9GAMM|nr:VOC family protein [Halomonas campisalis]MCG6658935.1 bleomycin resistance protein [Halomonas campisalis]MDR5863656.1 VOC family protein [Halomonas campisalis]